MAIDHILVIGFGGPEKQEDIDLFLQEVTRGLPIPPARIAEVKSHYERVGGRSPYNDYTIALFDRLTERLRQMGIHLPVFLGMRNWHPFLKHTLQEIKRQGLKSGLGIVLAPHRSDNSFEKYLRNVAEAKIFVQAPQVEYAYLGPWFDHPKFIEAQADRVRQALAQKDKAAWSEAPILFCAHSIPVAMAKGCRYVEEFECSSRLVAQALGRTNWHMAYQSRSGDRAGRPAKQGGEEVPQHDGAAANPREPWLVPDVESKLQALKASGASKVALVPIGFLCDNVEVLFDLDIEAKEEASKLGLDFVRVSTVMDHPAFVEMFAQLIGQALKAQGAPKESLIVLGQG